MTDTDTIGRRARSAALDRQFKAAARAAWSRGDYHRFAKELIWDLGAELVAACGIRDGDRVLDVACGSGNTALRAAQAGAEVVACDLTPENFPAGMREASDRNLRIDWVEADTEQLPFPDSSFDVVASSVGTMWAPDHLVVADELVRVCRPGGTIGLINFAAGGLIEKFLAVLDGFAPPPPPWAASPTRWGDERHLRTLFGNRVESLTITPGVYAERVPGGAAGYCAFYKETFGPIAAVFDQLADQPDRAAELDRRFLDFATDANRGRPGGSAELCFEYIVAIGRRR